MNRYRTNEAFETGGLDWLTIFQYLFMVLFGWVAIYSAVYNPDNSSIFDLSQNYGRQMMFIAIGLVLGAAILIVDAKFYGAFAYGFYALAIFLCIAVIFIGAETKGAKSWFALGGFKFQPVELAKYATALTLAKYLSSYDVSFKDFKVKMISFGIILLPMALVLLQNDTGSALVFTAFFLVLYREGLPTWLLAGAFYLAFLFVVTLLVDEPLNVIYVLGGLAAVLLVVFRKNKQMLLAILAALVFSIVVIKSVDFFFNEVLQEHQRARINVLFGKGGDDYNVRQSKIAIGSGGIFGQGFLNGTQTRYDYVPEQATDFIYCTIGEEYGFFGSAGVVLMFVLLMIRIVIIAERQKNRFSRIYAYSVACILFVHFTVNIGMTIGLMPIIGIPLPFFSYGGSSLLGFTILLFTLLKLDANRVNEMQSLHD
ncbi:MAG TPA: rod shape-determining protein RodA [Bacteroidetes bacterium]|nr:rod shape-determining protein RodA [Bacteroidota bacterium]